MAQLWEKRRILVLGMTYPSYSQKYKETVCTGGIFEDTKEMCRLHPIPYRYWSEDGRGTSRPFSSYNVIEVEVRKHEDPRPESFRVRPEGQIQVVEKIPTRPKGGWERRRRWLDDCRHHFGSVKQLKAAQRSHGTSLGIVVPRSIDGVEVVKKSAAKATEWLEQEKKVLAQSDMLRVMKPLAFIPYDFKVHFTDEDGSSCMKLHQWGLSEGFRRWFKEEGEARAVEMARESMEQNLDSERRDIYLFLGSLRGLQYQFTLMDSASPPKKSPTASLELPFPK